MGEAEAEENHARDRQEWIGGSDLVAAEERQEVPLVEERPGGVDGRPGRERDAVEKVVAAENEEATEQQRAAAHGKQGSEQDAGGTERGDDLPELTRPEWIHRPGPVNQSKLQQ